MNKDSSKYPTFVIFEISTQLPELIIFMRGLKPNVSESLCIADLYSLPFRPLITVGPKRKRLGIKLEIRLYSSIMDWKYLIYYPGQKKLNENIQVSRLFLFQYFERKQSLDFL